MATRYSGPIRPRHVETTLGAAIGMSAEDWRIASKSIGCLLIKEPSVDNGRVRVAIFTDESALNAAWTACIARIQAREEQYFEVTLTRQVSRGISTLADFVDQWRAVLRSVVRRAVDRHISPIICIECGTHLELTDIVYADRYRLAHEQCRPSSLYRRAGTLATWFDSNLDSVPTICRYGHIVRFGQVCEYCGSHPYEVDAWSNSRFSTYCLRCHVDIRTSHDAIRFGLWGAMHLGCYTIALRTNQWGYVPPRRIASEGTFTETLQERNARLHAQYSRLEPFTAPNGEQCMCPSCTRVTRGAQLDPPPGLVDDAVDAMRYMVAGREARGIRYAWVESSDTGP